MLVNNSLYLRNTGEMLSIGCFHADAYIKDLAYMVPQWRGNHARGPRDKTLN